MLSVLCTLEMNVENLFSSGLNLLAVVFGITLAAALIFVMALAIRRRQSRIELPVKPRAISIETELAMDVKQRWNKQLRRHPGPRF
jgi:hypothetical protein